MIFVFANCEKRKCWIVQSAEDSVLVSSEKMAKSTISIPVVNPDGRRPTVGRNVKIGIEAVRNDISLVIEAIGTGELTDDQHALLRSYIFAHYHPELKVSCRVRIYQAVKEALEDENLNQLRDIAGIKQKSAYINAITNVGKRSSYFGGLIGVTVAGHFFLPPFVKFGIIPAARRTIRKLVPRQIHLTPIDKPFKLSKLVGRGPRVIYKGICRALGPEVGRAGKPVAGDINTTAMDDLIGNLFFCSLIEQSSFTSAAKEDFGSAPGSHSSTTWLGSAANSKGSLGTRTSPGNAFLTTQTSGCF